MLDVKRIRADPDGVRAALGRRLDPSLEGQVERVLELDIRRRELLVETEGLKAGRNTASEEVARRKKAKEPADDLLADLKVSGDRVKALDALLREVDAEIDGLVITLPNLPHPGSPDGDASANRVVRSWGEIPRFDLPALPHWELGERLRLFDLPRGAKIAGSGFPVFTGVGARLIRSLSNFMLDLHTREHGYLELSPPYLVNEATATGTGQLPKFADEMYQVPIDGMYLIPTAEVPVTNFRRDEILDAGELPVGYTAWTPCFRREAGAHGKDTRGLIRVHQFDKVELVRLVDPARSDEEHALLTQQAETVLQRLELPYRVLELAAGDTGFASARTFDLEAWAPGVEAWLEVSSSSTFTDFQARRTNIRFRPAVGAKPEFVHTLNASALAFPRVIAALLETHQLADGRVRVPAALVPYLGVEFLAPTA